jgi:hypothetical protein
MEKMREDRGKQQAHHARRDGILHQRPGGKLVEDGRDGYGEAGRNQILTDRPAAGRFDDLARPDEKGGGDEKEMGGSAKGGLRSWDVGSGPKI